MSADGNDGAIKGARDHVRTSDLTELLAKIQPAMCQESLTDEKGQRNAANASFVENVSEINVRRSFISIVDRSCIHAQITKEVRLRSSAPSTTSNQARSSVSTRP